MADVEPVIVGIGMMTSVGLSAQETAASVRAGVTRHTESALCDKSFEPFILARVLEDGMPPLTDEVDALPGLAHREVRMLRLATRPLIEAMGAADTSAPVPLMLALPATETTRPLDPYAFLKNLGMQTEGIIDEDKSTLITDGRAGGLLAVGKAAELIQSGQSTICLAGGVDSYMPPYILGQLDQEGRIQSANTLDGFIPGEGAGFILLADRAAAERAGLQPLATIFAPASGLEEGHIYSDAAYQGEGLAGAMTEFLEQRNGRPPIAEVYSSMNGENHWAKEWGVSYLRNSSSFTEEYGMRHPADCFGDTGAACGPLMIALATVGINAGYRQSPCLVYCSSDRGTRSVLEVSSLEEQES